MKKTLISFLFLIPLCWMEIMVGSESQEDIPKPYGFQVVTITGETRDLQAYRDKVLLIVNTASKCGFTKQYKGLEDLWKAYGDRGLVVLGFPCNQFGGQEPAQNNDILVFCQTNFGVTFPLYAKIDVNGDQAHPLFVWLKDKAKGVMGSTSIKWNFTKFLVKPGGEEVERFASTTTPEDLKAKIEAWLPQKAEPKKE